MFLHTGIAIPEYRIFYLWVFRVCYTILVARITIARHHIPSRQPVPLTIFRSNSKFDQNLQCFGLKCTSDHNETLHTPRQCFKLEHSKFGSNFETDRNIVSRTGASYDKEEVMEARTKEILVRFFRTNCMKTVLKRQVDLFTLLYNPNPTIQRTYVMILLFLWALLKYMYID